jgi:hypothetical protein
MKAIDAMFDRCSPPAWEGMVKHRPDHEPAAASDSTHRLIANVTAIT